MAALVWVMMGLALWHFTIYLPDHFWAGIVGAFLGAVIGPLIFGFLIHGLSVPGESDTNVLSAIEAIPGAVIGMGIVYWLGLRQERAHPAY
jgi:predicted permease